MSFFKGRGSPLAYPIAIAGAVMAPTFAAADQVALKSEDGTVNLVGEFIEFSDNNYIIRTALGDLRVSSARVRCEGAACPSFDTASADVVIQGSDTVGLGLMPLMLSGYASFLDAEASISTTETEGEILATFVGDGGFGDEMVKVLVDSKTSSRAFEALLAKEAQVGMASRRIRPAEARALRDAGAGNMVSPNQENIVAIDSLVVITHPENPIESLTLNELQAIYSGDVTDWADVGGQAGPINVMTRPDGSGTRSVFESRIFGDDTPRVAPQAQITGSNNDMATAVNADEGAIGFVGYAFQRGAKPITLVNECGLQMNPDEFSAKTEEYALQRRLYLYNRVDTLDEATSEFLKYSLSSEADGVIAKSGFINLGVKRKAQDLDSSRARALLDPTVDDFEGGVMREMLSEMVDYDRLSTTFRFRTGSSRLDERGAIDMARLVSYLKDGNSGAEVLVVGFTDDVGAFESNRELSRVRAEEIARQLRAAGGDDLSDITISATGFGEISPATCNTSERGREINRRVEIWIRDAA